MAGVAYCGDYVFCARLCRGVCEERRRLIDREYSRRACYFYFVSYDLPYHGALVLRAAGYENAAVYFSRDDYIEYYSRSNLYICVWLGRVRAGVGAINCRSCRGDSFIYNFVPSYAGNFYA